MRSRASAEGDRGRCHGWRLHGRWLQQVADDWNSAAKKEQRVSLIEGQDGAQDADDRAQKRCQKDEAEQRKADVHHRTAEWPRLMQQEP